MLPVKTIFAHNALNDMKVFPFIYIIIFSCTILTKHFRYYFCRFEKNIWCNNEDQCVSCTFNMARHQYLYLDDSEADTSKSDRNLWRGNIYFLPNDLCPSDCSTITIHKFQVIFLKDNIYRIYSRGLRSLPSREYRKSANNGCILKRLCSYYIP